MEPNEQICIKAFFGVWRPAGAEQAREFCKSLMNGMTCTKETKRRRIEGEHLRERSGRDQSSCRLWPRRSDREIQLLWVDYLAELAARNFAADEIWKQEREESNGEKKKT